MPHANAHPQTPALHAVVPCGGSGSRAGAGLPKQYRTVAGHRVLAHTLRALAGVQRLKTVVVVVSADDAVLDEAFLQQAWTQLAPAAQLVICRQAGATRAHTVAAGLAWLSAQAMPNTDWVLVHDAARCLVTPQQINALIDACLPDAVGGLLALKLPDTLKAAVHPANSHRVASTVSREDKWLAQTPQMFRLGTLNHALALAAPTGYASVTDEASAVEAMGLAPLLVAGSAENFKLTYPADFALAQAILASRAQPNMEQLSTSDTPGIPLAATPKPTVPAMRVGEGWDCHALVPGRPLMLGGVQVPHTHGLLGHSDADVLLHAITDAVLGAAGLGDIGRHFPDTDPTFKGADSRRLLAEAMKRVRAAGWELVNLDCTVVAQAPKLAGYMPQMGDTIARTLGVHAGQVNVKAKTAERLGPVGQGLSLESRAVALLAACSA